MGLIDEYREQNTNPDYDYSLGGVLKEYGSAPAKGLATGITYLADLPYLGEGLLRGAYDIGSFPVDMITGNDAPFFDAWSSDKWYTQPYGSKVIDYDKKNDGYLATKNYNIPYFPDPQALNTGSEWGALGGINFGKNILTKPFSYQRGMHGGVFGTSSEYLQEGFDINDVDNIWGMAVDTPALIFNMIADYKSFRNNSGFIQKMLRETMGDVDDQAITKQLTIIQDRIAKANEQGVKLSAQQLFAEFPEMASLYRVLGMMDNGKTRRFNDAQGEALTKLLTGQMENLDEMPSILAQAVKFQNNYKNFTYKTNETFRKDIDSIKNIKISDDVGEQFNMKTLLIENIDNAWMKVGNRSSVGAKQLEYFTNLIDEAIQTGDIDKLNNVLKRVESDLATFSRNGMEVDGQVLDLEKGLDKIVKSLVDDSHLAVADNFPEYRVAMKKFQETMENSIDPLRAEKLTAFISEGGDPEKVIKAIDLLFSSTNHTAEDLAPIIKGLRAINGDGVIDDVFQMHITKIMKTAMENSPDDAMNVATKLSKKKQNYDRIKTLIKEDFKLKHGKYPNAKELDDASRGMINWLDTVNSFSKAQGESITAPLQAFQRASSQYGLDPRDLVNPATWTREIRDAWAKFNAQKLQKFMENSKNLDDLIRMSQTTIKDDLLNIVYLTAVRPYGTIGAEKMPYGFEARTDIKDKFQEVIDADQVFESGDW